MPKQVITEDGMSMLDVQASNIQAPIETEEKYSQSLSFLWGWVESIRRWKPILSDTDGRLLVSSSETQSNDGAHSNPEITIVSSTVLPTNVDRKLMIIQNFNAMDVYLSFDGGDATSSDFLLEAGATYIDNVYYGKVTGIVVSGTAYLNVVELT